MEIRIKESVVKEREEIEEVYTPEKIRALWDDDTAESSLVLALLEKWEQAERQLAAMTAAMRRIDETLRVPAAEYVPAIGDVFDIIDKTIGKERP